MLASTVGGTERPGLSRPSPPAPPLPIASSAARSLLLRSNTLAIAAAEVEEWRVLHKLPEGGDVMDVDENDFSNDDDNDDDDDDEEFMGNSSNVYDEGDSGEVEEVRDHDDDDEDSAANSAFEEVPNQLDNDNEFNESEANNNNEVDDESASDDEVVAVGNSSYEEDSDDDDEAYDNLQFDDAVINLDDINLASSDHGTRNPHRQSTSRSNTAGFRSFGDASGAGTAGSSSVSGTIGGLSPIELALKKREREQNFLCAAMSILAAQFPALAAESRDVHRRLQKGLAHRGYPFLLFHARLLSLLHYLQAMPNNLC